MNSVKNGKITDCVLFKQELHETAYKASGAYSFDEYIKYANEAFYRSDWYKIKGQEKRMIHS
jgi:hypothetical protein